MLSVEMVHGSRRLWAELNDAGWCVRRFTEVTCHTNEEAAIIVGGFFREGCDRFTVHLEDCILVCPNYGLESADTIRHIVAFDTMTGRHYEVVLSIDEIVAILMLSIGGDAIVCADDAYKILEKALTDWPTECRPIP